MDTRDIDRFKKNFIKYVLTFKKNDKNRTNPFHFYKEWSIEYSRNNAQSDWLQLTRSLIDELKIIVNQYTDLIKVIEDPDLTCAEIGDHFKYSLRRGKGILKFFLVEKISDKNWGHYKSFKILLTKIEEEYNLLKEVEIIGPALDSKFFESKKNKEQEEKKEIFEKYNIKFEGEKESVREISKDQSKGEIIVQKTKINQPIDPIVFKGTKALLFKFFAEFANEGFLDKLDDFTIFSHFLTNDKSCNNDQTKKIRWKKNLTDLVYLINKLSKERLLGETTIDEKWKIVSLHFVDQKGESISINTLSSTSRNISKYGSKNSTVIDTIIKTCCMPSK